MKAIVGVGGGIAAYKAAELSRALQEKGAAVQVVMTAGACQFVQPLTFAALTGRKVITGLWAGTSASADETLASSVEHIRVAQENDVLVVAPATADLLAKFACGLADDFLTTLYLAFQGQVVLAPAMNTAMWQHSATCQNVEALRKRARHHFVQPPEGLLACGTTGPGRLAEPSQIVSAVLAALEPDVPVRRDLEGEVVLVTAGPTREPLDPVRFISNRSSGKMGYAIAEAAVERGAEVILVSGPVAIQPPKGVRLLPVETAAEMRAAVFDNLEPTTIIVKAAAVADYHLAEVPSQKVKKTATRPPLQLDPTPDILAELGQRKGDRLLIGFAAETENLIVEAKRKLKTKNCDMVVGNLVNLSGIGFESEENEVVLVQKAKPAITITKRSKREIANRIFDQALTVRLELHTAAS